MNKINLIKYNTHEQNNRNKTLSLICNYLLLLLILQLMFFLFVFGKCRIIKNDITIINNELSQINKQSSSYSELYKKRNAILERLETVSSNHKESANVLNTIIKVSAMQSDVFLKSVRYFNDHLEISIRLQQKSAYPMEDFLRKNSHFKNIRIEKKISNQDGSVETDITLDNETENDKL